MFRRLLALGLGLAALSPALHAQVPGDVELLGRVHGTRPPQAYYELMARRPDAFNLKRAWKRRAPAFRGAAVGADLSPRLGVDGPAGVLGPREGAVEGTFRFPLLLGSFSDSPVSPPFTPAQVQIEFFDGPNSRYATIPEFYAEVSGGKVVMVGETHGWERAALTQSQVTAEQSALPGRVGDFIIQLLAAADDGSINWGLYDNDGPDGIPNSGDDDGFVDLLAVMHPTQGAECDGSLDRVWSHKWSLQEAVGQVFWTNTPSASGGRIRVDDYAIQPVRSCDGSSINQIGVFAHELGHGFGLPDLYCTSGGCAHTGVGRWGLMGSGAWGCTANVNTPERPCHMEAWSKAMLGWVELETLPTGADLGVLTLPPVERQEKVFRLNAPDGSGDYFLIENRQRVGFDGGVPATGLLVWRIDAQRVAGRWAENTVNNDRNRLGVWLLQADGLNNLGSASGSNRGDAGDPFPGSSGAVQLHAGSTPSTLTHQGNASGLTLLGIEQVGEDMYFRALTRFQEVTVRTAGDAGTGGLLTVNGVHVSGTQTVLSAAPFQHVPLEAAAGENVSDGVRRGFERWQDDNTLPRTRTFVVGLEDAVLVAEYGNLEMRVRTQVQGEQFGVSPGTVSTNPTTSDLWFPQGTQVTFTAGATTGFRFLSWTGTLAGATNPVTRALSAPVDATAVFELSYRVAGASQGFEAAVTQELVLLAENGNAPVTWTLLSGRVPEGMSFDPSGLVRGAALESGDFALGLQAVGALGLTATGTVTLNVARPNVGVGTLVSPFLLATPPLPTELQAMFLDRAGNGNGFYDLGDLRAFLLANPGLPMTAAQQAAVRMLVPVLSFGRGLPAGER